MRVIVICLVLETLVATRLVGAPPLQNFEGATFVNAEYNDGDSFRIRYIHNGQPEESVVRLYFVDAFESTIGQESDKRRLLEQTREFGFAAKDRARGVEFG